MNVASACIFFFLLLISAQTANAQKKITFIKPGNEYYDTKGSVINTHGGGFVYYKKKYYWVGEYKTAGAIGDTAQVGVRCYSSKDLLNWKNEGIAFGVSADALHPIAKGCILERPTVVYNQQTAMFVMWFHLEPKGVGYDGALSGVAISKNIAGPYRFLHASRPDKGQWLVNVLPVNKTRKFNDQGKRFSGSTLTRSS